MYRLIIVLLFVPLMGHTQAITDGLIGYWPFNGNANDESGTGLNGQVIEATLTTGKENEKNRAYQLSKRKYIEVSDHEALDFGAGEFSVSAWINKTNAYNQSYTAAAFIGKWKDSILPGANEWHLSAGGNGSHIPNFTIVIGGTSYATGNTEPLALNVWYYLVAVRKATSIELYIDGVLRSSLEVPAGKLNNMGSSLYFGRFAGYSNYGAKIDDVMLYNRALGAEEVTTIYGGPPEGGVPDAIEYQALVDLYNSTNGAGWVDNTNWLHGNTIADMATWYGVTVTNGDVMGLSLAVNDLDGEIPASLGNLKKLENINLSVNQLRGGIPETLGDVTDLLKLYLNNNNLTGEIPASIVDLLKLQQLALAKNQLTGSIPSDIGNLTELKALSLGYNSLTGEIPASIIKLTQLTDLNLEFNDLIGSLPPAIKSLSNLGGLLLRDNSLSGPIPADIVLLTNLKKIDLRHNDLSGKIPENIGNLDLIYIFLGGNSLTGTIPESLGNCNNMVYLNLHSNQLTGSIPASLGNLKKLTDFFASSNQLTGEIPDSLGGMTNLLVLYLAGNKLTGSLPSSLSNLKQIKRLVVANNQLEGNVPEEINTLENLSELSLYKNRFTSFPDFSANPRKQSMIVAVSENRLKFKHLEKNFSEVGKPVFSSFSYRSQSPLPPDTLAFTAGQTVILNTEDNALHNRFQWQKLVNGTWTNIPEATSGMYSMPSISAADATSYRCYITNDWITNVTIYSRTFVVQTTSEFWSVGDGNWTTDRIWSATKGGAAITGYPQSGSRVYIVGNSITLSDSLSCGPLEVIVENAETSLTVDGAEITVHGEVKLSKTTEGYPGSIKIVNGGKLIPIE